MHHIVSDGWSLDVFTRETQALYEALGKDEPNPLRELEIQYADFAIWQRGYLTAERLGRKVAFWKGLLADAPQSLELPTDRPRPPVQSHRGTAMSFDLAAPALTARAAGARGRTGCDTVHGSVGCVWGASGTACCPEGRGAGGTHRQPDPGRARTVDSGSSSTRWRFACASMTTRRSSSCSHA